MSWTGKPFIVEKTFDKCLSCGSEQLETLRQEAVGEGCPGTVFIPLKRKLKFLRNQLGVVLRGDSFQMCRDCGFIYRQDSPDELNQFLKKYVKD